MNHIKKVPLVYGNSWSKEVIEDCKKNKKLLRVAVAIPGGEKNNECNMRCIFCFTKCGTRHNQGKVIDNKTILDFIDEVQEYVYDPDLMNYYFVSEGEPLLNNNLIDILKKVSKLGGTMTMFTNLYEITEEQIKAFGEIKNLFICGKLYGITPETNDYLTNTPGSFDKMMKNIKKLIDAGLAEEGRLGIQCVVTSANYHEVFDIFKWARENKVAPHIMMYREQGLGEGYPELSIPQEKILEIFERCSKYDKENGFENWNPKLPLLVLGDCDIPGINLYLTTNGDVNVCAGDVRTYGNYFENTVKEMMESELLENVTKEYKKCPWVNI